MLPFFSTKNLKDITDKLRGKRRRFRFPRSGGSLLFTGRLLAFFRHEELAEGLCPPAAGLVELLAVFMMQSGYYLVYYIVVYPELERQPPRQEYARVCRDATALRHFFAAMAYPNKWRFVDRILAESAGETIDRAEAPAAAADETSVATSRGNA